MTTDPASLTPANSPAADPASTANTQPAGPTPAGFRIGPTPNGNQPTEPEEIESLPAWAQKQIKDLRAENKRRREAADEAKRQADEERLAADKKWEELATKRADEIKTLSTYKERYEELATAQRSRIQTEIAAWPAEIKALAPAADADVTDWAAWADKARPLAQALTAGSNGTSPTGQTQPPKPAGQGMKADAERQAQAQQRVQSRF